MQRFTTGDPQRLIDQERIERIHNSRTLLLQTGVSMTSVPRRRAVSGQGRHATLHLRPAQAGATALLLAASVVGSQSVYAQTQTGSTGNGSQAAVLEEVQVTGTRVMRDGYEAPTPLTVMGSEEIKASAP